MMILNSYRFGGGAPPAGLLLDDYPNAAAAYSLRQLRTGVTNVVRVRESGGNTEADFTAAQITDGTLTAFCGANDGFVTKWYDQSGNNNFGYNTVVTRQMQIVSAGVLITDPSTSLVSTYSDDDCAIIFNTAIVSTDLISHFFVANLQNATATDYILNYGGNDSAIYGNPTASMIWRPKFSSGYAFCSFGFGTLTKIISVHRTGSNALASDVLQAYSNGTNAVSSYGGAGNVDNDDVIQIGRDGQNAFKGYFSEFICYVADKTSDRVAIETEINTHYGVY